MACIICGTKEPGEARSFTCQDCQWALVVSKARTKVEYEDLFTQACWIYNVWDLGNKRALKTMDFARCNLDPDLCVRIDRQISDIKLRRIWLEAYMSGEPLPRVCSPVRRHFEKDVTDSHFRCYEPAPVVTVSE